MGLMLDIHLFRIKLNFVEILLYLSPLHLVRILAVIFVHFRCHGLGNTFSLHESIDFYMLNSNSFVVSSRNPQFICNLRSNIDTFHLNFRHFSLETSCYLQFCTSSSL